MNPLTHRKAFLLLLILPSMFSSLFGRPDPYEQLPNYDGVPIGGPTGQAPRLTKSPYLILPNYAAAHQGMEELVHELQSLGWQHCPGKASSPYRFDENGDEYVMLKHPQLDVITLTYVREGSEAFTNWFCLDGEEQGASNPTGGLWDFARFGGGYLAMRKGALLISLSTSTGGRRIGVDDFRQAWKELYEACSRVPVAKAKMLQPSPTKSYAQAVLHVVIAMEAGTIPVGDTTPWMPKYLAIVEAQRAMSHAESELRAMGAPFEWRTTILTASLLLFGAAAGIWILRRYA